MSKRKNGFTLVELLAVIVILAVILVIAVPKIMNVIKEARYGAIKSSVKVVANGVEKEYANRLMLGKDTSGITCADVSKLGSDYKSCTITLDSNGKATVTIVGQNKFEGITCTGNKNEVTCGEIDNSIKNYPTMVASYGWYKGQIHQSNVETIEFVDSYTPTGSEIDSWNVDVDDTGEIKAYIVAPGYVLDDLIASGIVDNTDENEVKVIIAGNGSGGIFANEDSSCMFGHWCLKGSGYSDDDHTNLRNLTKIEGLSILDTSKVTDMSSMFKAGDSSYFSKVRSLDLSHFDTSNVTDMSRMFYQSYATTLDLSSFDTSNVTNMSHMFAGSDATTLDLSSFDTSNVTDMDSMFSGSSATTGQARTQEDADRLNASYGKPSTLTFVVSCSNQKFSYAETQQVSSFDVNEEACKTFFVGKGQPADVTETLCTGGEVEGLTMKFAIKLGYFPASELETAGVISNVQYVDGISITGYGRTCPKDVIIPSKMDNKTVVRIENYALADNDLKSVTIPNSVTTIGEGAFRENQLTSVTIGNSVTSIGPSAFAGNQLTSVTIPNSVTEIGSGSFASNQLTSVTIPNSVTTIGSGAFAGNQLTRVTIPDSVTSIEVAAFYKASSSNPSLSSIVNTTGRSFDWSYIITGSSGTSSVTGTYNDVSVTSE